MVALTAPAIMLSIVPLVNFLLNFCVLNAQSIRNKVSDLNDLIIERKLDVLVITESWLKMSDPEYALKVKELCPDGYSYISEPRPKKLGGGISLVFKSSLDLSVVKPGRKPKYFECLSVVVDSAFLIVSVYRTPPKNLRRQFLAEFDDFLSQLMTKYTAIIVCGDVNLHFEDPSDLFAKQFLTLSHDYGFNDHVVGTATHARGGSLDILMSKGLSCHEVEICDIQLSDHFPIFAVISLLSTKSRTPKVKAIPRYYQFRDYKLLDCDEFYCHVDNELKNAQLSNSSCEDPNILADELDGILCSSVDRFAPVVIRKTTKKKSPRYKYDPVVAEAKSVRRQLERKFRKSGLEIDRQLLKGQRLVVRKLAHQSKARYFQSKISACSTTRQLFDTVNRLTTENADKLPTSNDDKFLAEKFSCYFADKVGEIVSGFQSSPSNDVSEIPPIEVAVPVFDEFTELTASEVEKLRPIKCSSLDHVNNDALRKIWSNILPLLTQLVNITLRTGIFPTVYKEAHIKPLIKSSSLDPEALRSYRPVSNLSFFSKIIETAINNQLMDHFSQHNLLSPFQSAYRRGHSVETTITHVSSSILRKIDQGHQVFLVLLDLSAAFDTICHEKLLCKLKRRFGIVGTPLKLLRSYLMNRTSRVKIHSSLSDPKANGVGVPQGSVLGPVLFNCVMSDLSELLQNEGAECHLYADDTQFWVGFPPGGESYAREKITRCFKVVKDFMWKNCLKLNSNKTQFLPISKYFAHTEFEPLVLDDQTIIRPSADIRNLGVTFDCNLSFHKHISLLRQSCFYQLKRVKSIQSYLPHNSLETLIHAFITSRIDFCNIIYNGLPDYLIASIQSIQNACAKAITRARRFDSATEQLFVLHWLPVKKRAEYKALLMCHKVAHCDSDAPQYINDVVKIHTPARFTRSCESVAIKSDFKAKLKSAGERAIDHYFPKLWNDLPASLKNHCNLTTFKSNLKTYLFRQHFN